MSDFTFDELEELLDAVNTAWRRVEGQEGDEWILPIEAKLKNMIDNYCATNGHIYQYSGGWGYCENCGEKE